jgi:ABC-type amino acid transport substrate-binding protein
MRAIQDRRQLVVGIKFDSPPFGFKDPRTEEVVGFDADAARAVGDALGVPVRFVETTSSNRIPFLRNGRVDIVFATMTITPERAKIVQFSDPYYIAPGRILVKRGNAEIREVPDLNGKRVCLTIGSTFGASVRKLAPRVQLREVDGYSACAQLLDVNAVDAVVSEDVSLIGMILRNSDFELVGPSFTEEPFGAAMARDHPEWQTFVNAVLASMKSGGSWKSSYDKWIGSQTHSAATPPSRTLSELLAKEGSP